MNQMLYAALAASVASVSLMGESINGVVATPQPFTSDVVLPSKSSFDQISKLYCYPIKKVSSSGGTLTFEDDSSWNIGLFAMGTVSQWEVGDRVAIWSEGSSLPKPFTLFNVSKLESARADLNRLSNKYSIHGLWVTHASEEGGTIYLNNGAILCSPYQCFRHQYFSEGNRAYILSDIEQAEPRYALWMENGVIAVDLELLP